VLCHFLHRISAHSDHNLMDTVNLALVMAPNLLPMTTATTMATVASRCASNGRETPLEASTSVIEILIENCNQIGLVPEGIVSVARQLVDDYGADYKWRDLGDTPDGLGKPTVCLLRFRSTIITGYKINSHMKTARIQSHNYITIVSINMCMKRMKVFVRTVYRLQKTT